MLLGSLLLGFAVEAANGERFAADDGDAAFAEAQTERADFSIGDHPALAGACSCDDAVLYKQAQFGFPQIAVCMRTT